MNVCSVQKEEFLSLVQERNDIYMHKSLMNNASLNLQCLIVDFIRFQMTNDSFRVFFFF